MATAKQLQDFAARSANWELLSLLIVASSLEHIHAVQAHKPASIPERAAALVAALADAALTPQPAPAKTAG